MGSPPETRRRRKLTRKEALTKYDLYRGRSSTVAQSWVLLSMSTMLILCLGGIKMILRLLRQKLTFSLFEGGLILSAAKRSWFKRHFRLHSHCSPIIGQYPATVLV